MKHLHDLQTNGAENSHNFIATTHSQHRLTDSLTHCNENTRAFSGCFIARKYDYKCMNYIIKSVTVEDAY